MNIINKTLIAAMLTTPLCPAMPLAAQTQNYDSRFDQYLIAPNHTDEAIYTPGKGTKFTLWAPSAQEAIVNIYPTGHGSPALASMKLTKQDNGLWSTIAENVCPGMFYTFQILHNGKWLDPTPGIWAKATGVNGHRAAIIDFTQTNPTGWDTDKGPSLNSITDAVIYEMHHRDFSVHPSSGIANKGKFLALTELYTTNPQGLATGIDHLKELGVTHIHILPSYDYNSVDEANLPANTYNWGYDPYNYNTPEGSYSTNPSNPATRVAEMKEMIKALHDAGIGVIMDVVYNHTANNDDSNFSLTAPGYFYRHRPDGSYSDASGCGNETASDREMMRQFIINSVKYWAQEYHIDGFRFDLMAIHDINTMNQVAQELRKINPNIIIYGEGWTAGDSPLPAPQRALKENVAQMEGVAVFSDDIRDAIKGHYSNASDRGFATGKPGLEETIKIGIVASTPHPQVDFAKGNNSKFPYASAPTQIINYVSCHDDLTLTDKLAKSMPEASAEQRQRAAKLAQTIVFTSQGTPFMFAGEEVFRGKKGVHNSYNSPDSINAIDWNLKTLNQPQFDYYRNLIALRKSHPAFRMTNAADIAKNIVFDPEKRSNVVSYSIKNHAGGDSWKEIKLVFNGNPDDIEVKIPKGDWQIIALDGEINPQGLGQFNGGKISVPQTSALILARVK